ncbi:MAG TPA: amino acid adenylation domain-containing protein [Thermoanaerobaculia bacterium]|nr:amino acid adenylation domain-containing protein [Thermoanaerobaculia bacterium]
MRLHALVLVKPGSIPKTTSGKIQRRQTKADFLAGRLDALGEWRRTGGDASSIAGTAGVEVPTEDVGRWLAHRIAAAAGVGMEEITPDTPIADYGLDSLKAIELLHEVETRTGVPVPLETFFGGLTIGQLVAQLGARPEVSVPLAPSGEESGTFPLSDGQKALWFLWQLEPDSPAYNLTAAVALASPADPQALRRAFQGLVDRHPALRTTFAFEGGEPVQKVHAYQAVAFEEVDAAGWSDGELLRRLDEEANRPFDLAAGPLLSVRLYRRSEALPAETSPPWPPSPIALPPTGRGGNPHPSDLERQAVFGAGGGAPLPAGGRAMGEGTGVRSPGDQVLLLTLHHIVGDFWSLAVLARELGALYRGALLPAPELRYTDYVRWQREALAGPPGERLRGYWQRQLAGELPALDLPTDRPRPPVQTYGGSAVPFRLDPETARRLKSFAQDRHATLYMTLLAAFQALLHRWSGQTDVLVGSPSASRSRASLAGVVGYFVNPVVLRADLATDLTFAEFLAQVRQTVLSAFEHQDYPFPTLVERLQPERDPSRSPIFQAMFALQSAPTLSGAGGREQDLTAFAVGEEGAEIEVGGLRLRHVPLPQRIAQFDLTLSMGEAGGSLAGSLDFNTDLFDRATADRMVGSFQTLLEAAVADPGRRVSELPLVAGAERNLLLVDWNRPSEPAAELPAGALVHELFAAQAERTPEAVAVFAGDDRITYRELNERAEQLAAHLRSLGVKPGEVVGLSMARSFDLVAGTLGILKAGAGYLPLDPEIPEERRAFMVKDAGVKILLTPDPSPIALPSTGRGASPPAISPLSRSGGSAMGEGGQGGEESACMIYTSGSTGEPKGVVLEHRNLVSMIASFLGSYEPGVGDVVLPLTSVASASFVGEILPPLCSGAAVVMADKGETLDFERLADLIARHGVSILSTVPSMVAGLNAIKGRLPKLRLILSGGEALSVSDVDRLLDTAEVVNGYGLTETSICSTVHRLSAADFEPGATIPIGRPVTGHRLYVLDGHFEARPVGAPGELFIAGEGVARGYQGNPAGTAARFLPDPFSDEGARMYRTGDLARWRSGRLEYLGRIDQQVKIRGFRVELGEIEAVLGRHPEVRECAVVPRDERLVAYVVGTPPIPTAGELIAFLKDKLPAYMVPAAFVMLPSLPLTANGKLDVKALPVPEQLRPELAAAFVAPRGELERVVADVWKEALKVDKVGVNDNFFDLGGHSLLMTRVHAALKEALAAHGVTNVVSLIDLFRYPTISTLVRFLAPAAEETNALDVLGALDEGRRRAAARQASGRRDEAIAIIGMSAHVSGARNVEQLWQNLVNKVESIRHFTDEELLAAGNDPELIANPNYVKAQGIVGDVELFDAGFFGYNPRSAELTDPQHRVFLECAWEAMEIAGYDTDRYPGRVGVFAGQSMNTYWLKNLYYHIDLVASVDSLAAAIGNDKDSITTEVSYRMNLRGPSVLVQSSSSTSLTAIHYACLSLLNHECDMAIAGGASVHVPEISGYMYQEGGITDPEGHCRTFDADAKGFVSGHGGGAVILKRLSEALADGDNVLAVIKGSACNNDGSNKVSYMAPSVDGHADVIRMAQAAAGVTPDTITYVEAHGTGTLLGDPIEVAAFTQAFRTGTDKKQYCAIGSVKTNIGHLDTAAGVAGLMKTALCLHHKTLVPICHFERPNPKIDFESSPFYVSTELRPWDTPDGIPRRAGVSSLGMGGTNTHVILEEAPPQEPSGPSRPFQLLLLSAKTATALETLTHTLANHLREHPDQPLADIAFTLQTGRKVFANRRFVVSESADDAALALQEMEPDRIVSGYREAGERSVAFLFPGQGSQYPNMGLGLYASEPVFRDAVDRCCELLKEHLDGVDLREVLYPHEGADLEEAGERLRQTMFAQPALFVIEYATAQLFLSWGIKPQALIGHSVGEYTAACLAGVFTLEDGLALVAKRGKLVQSLPSGAMLAVPLPEAEVLPLLASHPAVSVGAINRIDMTVVSGAHEAVAAFRKEMEEKRLDVRPVHTSHAFHSAMMDPILDELRATVARVPRQAPRIPYLSNVTGTWIRPEEATSPDYWAAQLRGAVRFTDNLGELMKDPDRVLLEVGPSNVLSTSARVHPAKQATHAILSTMRHPKEKHADAAFVLTALGRLWLAGADVDFNAFWAGEKRRRVPLPTYPFERQRYWVDPLQPELAGRKRVSKDPADWYWVPSWKRTEKPGLDLHELAGKGNGDATRWLLFTSPDGVGPHLERRLRELGADVTTVVTGDGRLDPRREEDYAALVAGLKASGKLPSKVVHLWSTQDGSLEETLDRGYYSLVFLARALSTPEIPESEIDLLVVTSGVQEVTGDEELRPERATVLGPAKVIPREMPKIRVRSVDVPAVLPSAPGRLAAMVDGLLGELGPGRADPVIAYRGAHRWVQVFEQVKLDAGNARLREGGVYLITGGLGGLGLAVAEHLAREYRAKLILLGRSGLGEGDRMSRRIHQVKKLEELGAEVVVESADSSDRERLREVKLRALARFGAIHGIFHAAGVPGMGLIQTKTREIAEGVFAPKVRGTLALAEVFADLPLDFVVLFSSVTALLSQPGQSGYAAANGFLDAFARAERLRGGLPVVSVDWDAWQEVGMAVETEVPAEFKAWREESLKKGLSPAQGVDALERVLRSSLVQVAVSREDFQARVEESYASKSLEELAAQAVEVREIHARPVLGSAYVAPRTELEAKIAALWQEILGIDQVGIHDNFFDLGGNSLVGLKVISRVKSELQADVTSVSLFEGPTVSSFAKLLQSASGEQPQEPVAAYEERRSRGALRREKLRQRRG